MNRTTSIFNLEFDPKDEATLVALARHDPEAFSRLYRHYVERIYRYLFSHVDDKAEAEDLTSKVFKAAWENLGNYRERGEFAAWLFSIARNKVRDYHRRRRAHISWELLGETSQQQDESCNPQARAEKSDDLERLANYLRQLNPHQMELIRLRFAADLSYRDIASLLGRSEASVKMAMNRLLRQLKKRWEMEDE